MACFSRYAAVLCLLALLAGTATAQQASFTSAMQKLGNLTFFPQALSLAGLSNAITPDFAGIVVAPSDQALFAAQAANPGAATKAVAQPIFEYHILPNATLPTAQGQPSVLATSTLPGQSVNINLDTSGKTQTYYFFGTANNTVAAKAADCTSFNKNATLCKVGGVMVPPATVNAPTVYQYISTNPDLSTFKQLADMLGLNSTESGSLNDPTLDVAVFAPNNAAFSVFLKANPNLDSNQTSAIFFGHIAVGPRPFWNANPALPNGTLVPNVPTASPDGNTLNITKGAGVQSTPARGDISGLVPFQSADGFAGMSLVHVITGVLDVGVPGVNNTKPVPLPVAAGPTPGNETSTNSTSSTTSPAGPVGSGPSPPAPPSSPLHAWQTSPHMLVVSALMGLVLMICAL